MNDRFLYADIRMSTPKDTDPRQIDLTPFVDVWEVLDRGGTSDYTVLLTLLTV